MKEIKLLEMETRDFIAPGVLGIAPDGKSFNLYGDNGSGKTTIFDAFVWLFWDEDAEGRGQFDIKTLTPDGEAQHHKEHSVRAVVKVNGERAQLRKTYQENWTKGSGQSNGEFEGHETVYEFNDVEVTKSDYHEKLADLIYTDELFASKPEVQLKNLRVLVDPRYFNQQLHWERRRELLIDTFGDVNHEDILDEEPELENLDLNGLEPEDRRKQLKQKQSDIKKQQDKIEIQIKEKKRDAPEVDWTVETAEEQVANLKEKEQKLRDELAEVRAAGDKAEIKKEIEEMNRVIDQMKQDRRNEYAEKINDMKKRKNKTAFNLGRLATDFEDQKEEIKSTKDQIAELESRRDDLREKFYELQERVWDEGRECPTCGSQIDTDKLDEVREEFNRDLVEEKRRVQKRGKAAKSEQGELEEKLEELREEQDETVSEIHQLARNLRRRKDELEELKTERDNFSAIDEYAEMLDRREELQGRLNSGGEPERAEELKIKLENVQDDLEKAQDRLNQAKNAGRVGSRVDELKDKESMLAAEYEELARQMQLLNQYTRVKVRLMEAKINHNFDVVDFKLFRPYKSKEGVKEVCEAMVNGVSYNSTLNTEGRFRAGVDIINTFSEAWGLRGPVWLDNADLVREENRKELIESIKSQYAVLLVSDDEEPIAVY